MARYRVILLDFATPMSNTRVERRLAAILAADVAGYSRLMGADEEGTLAALKALRRELVDPKITEHRGRIVKTTGDGLLVEFASVVDAVRSAAAVQRAMAERNTGEAPEKRIEFRIGIHQGDIIVEDGDIFGDGVNLAARLEGIAEPGGICVSGRVQSDAAGKVDVSFEDLGEQQVKNIARPVHVFAIRLDLDVVTVPARARLALPDKPSLAVLPFQNMSGDPEQEYFADGIVEDITTAIARLPWLFVIARNSSFTYKGKSVDLKQVGRELGVRYVLEGSVRKAGNRVRITGQLIDTATGAHIWADRIDGALDDIFELQDQVASSVAGAIEPKLRLAEIERATRKPTDSLDAYDLYLRAVAQFHKYTEEGMRAAIALVRRALAIDPSYAPAAAMIGWCRTMQRMQGWGAVSDSEGAEAVLLARQATEAGRDDPDALCLASFAIGLLAGEHSTAMSAIDRALALNPNSALAWAGRGWFLGFQNQPVAAIEAEQQAMRLSPLDPLAFFSMAGLAFAHMTAGRYEEAIEWADRASQAQPRFVQAMRCKLVCLAHLGRTDETSDWLKRVLALQPGLTVAAWTGSYASTAVFSPEVLALIVDGYRKAGVPEE
jgi:TolB-like protein/class 3 adenylate cyclase